MTRPPEMLSHMAPLDCLELEKAHFLGPRDKSALNSPTASTAESFTTVSPSLNLNEKLLTIVLGKSWTIFFARGTHCRYL